MKKMLAWLLSLSMLVAMVPAVSAEGDEEYEVDQTQYAEDASGTGWSYEAETMTLTLDGYDEMAAMEDGEGLSVSIGDAPEGFQIVLAEGSVNKFWTLYTPFGRNIPIRGEGTLEVDMSTEGDLFVDGGNLVVNGPIGGSLTVNSGTVSGGALNGENVVINGGEVELGMTQVPESVVVNGGTLDVGALLAYSLEINGGVVNAEYLVNGYGSSLSAMDFTVNGGELILNNESQDSEVIRFICYGTDIEGLRQKISGFADNMVDAEGNPIVFKYLKNDAFGEEITDSSDTDYDAIFVRSYNSDGTLAYYAEYRAPEEDDSAVFTIGEEEFSYKKDASGDGWSYNAETMALTLDGLKKGSLDLESAPKGVHIVLAPGSENMLRYLNLPWSGYTEMDGMQFEEHYIPISGEGSLHCGNISVYGSLQIDSGTVWIEWMTGALLVNGGDVTVDSIKAAPSVVVNGGSLDIDKLDTYVYEQYGGTVRASMMTNCNGTDLDGMNYVLSGGSFILDDSEEEYVSDMGAFFCLVWESTDYEFSWEFDIFANSLVGEDGQPLDVVIYGYDENGEVFENPNNSYVGMCHAILRNSDGTPAHYVEYAPSFVLDGESHSFRKDASGDGWSYDAATQTLTLDGIEMVSDPDEYSDLHEIDLSNAPEGMQIELASGSENAVDGISVPEAYAIPVSGGGTLNTRTYGGFLCLNSGNVHAGAIYGPLVVNGGTVTTSGLVYGNLTMNGGTADLHGTKASSSVIINGGDLTINELDAYTYAQFGGTVKAVRMSNCNGIDVSAMKYILAGGTLILDNRGSDYEDWFLFNCATSPGGSTARAFRDVLSGFDGSFVDADGNPIVLKINARAEGYDDSMYVPDSYVGWMDAKFVNRDGTPAHYAEYRSTGPCQHEASWLRSDDDGHWSVCGKCGGDMEDTRAAHDYTPYGPVDYCECGHLTTELEVDSESGGLYDEDVTEEIVQLGLKMWLGEAKMASQIKYAIDYDWEGITLEKIARLQLIAQGEEVPESFAAFGMTYRGDRSVDTFSAPENLSGSWDMVKVFILDPVTFAPLAAPIEIAK